MNKIKFHNMFINSLYEELEQIDKNLESIKFIRKINPRENLINHLIWNNIKRKTEIEKLIKKYK